MTKVGSLCSGYHGLSLALPGEPVWFAENNPDMGRLLGKHYPDVSNYESIRPVVIDWARFERPDEIHAGFPCQPISAAGRQHHREDARYLWPDVARIVHVTRPRAVWLENVERIVSIDHGSVLHEVLDDLRSLGYFTRWTVIGACATGLAAWEILNNACEPVGIPLEYGS
jgi:DNA (cytosine-5)-methyltransferase 1